MAGMKNKICSIITMILCVLVPVCVFLPLVKLDLSPITGEISSFFSDVKLWEDGLKYSTVDIVKQAVRYREEMGGHFWMFLGCGLIQYLFPVVIFGFSWMKGKVKYIINLVLAAVAIIIAVCANLLWIPQGIEKVIGEIIDNSIVGNVLDIFHVGGLTDTFAKEAAKVYSKSLSIGFYFPIILLALIMLASIVGIVLFKEEPAMQPQMSAQRIPQPQRNRGSGIQATVEPALVGLTGIFKGAVIPVARGEVLIIGRDASQCNLVIEAQEISRKHCAVSFDEMTGQYKVTDYSSNGTFINSERRVMKNQPQFVQRGDVISVGGSQNSFRLN